MIIKGIIESIDFSDNTCVVRMPIFEGASQKNKASTVATFSIIPGIYNSYKVNDVVYIAFENGELQNPVIIGKLYLGSVKESTESRGVINCESLTAKNNSSLPYTTTIAKNQNQDYIESANSTWDFSTLADFIKNTELTVNELLTKIKDLEEQVNNLKLNKN